MTSSAPALRVVLDWGTTSFRAVLVDGAGAPIDRIETGNGIQNLTRDQFPLVLAEALQGWRAAHGALEITAAGMIGSRNGWVEMPYAACPAGLAELAAGVRRITFADGLAITFIPGLTDQAATPFPDVMRGEETQIAGVGLDRDRTIVLPGTHSKWAAVNGGRITRFQTFVTGEVFATLLHHSFFAKGAQRPAQPDWNAFARGLDIARSKTGRHAGLLSNLFAIRTGWLAGKVDALEMGDMLSGIVVGAEFVEAARAGWQPADKALTVIGGPELVEIYRRAGAAFGLAVEAAPPLAAVTGALAIAGAAR